MLPTIMGFPLWRGKITNRIGKKYICAMSNHWMLKYSKFI